jgi:predicted RNase H-like nuclease (RuvC/YqgF family)
VVATDREKVWLRLDRELLLKARDLARTEHGDETKWREIVEEALSDFFVKRVQDVDLASLLSRTEQALFDRLYDKIEREFTEMTKRTVNRVGNLVAPSSYDAALTAIMVEEMFKERHSKKYHEARKLAAERMRNRWEKEGAGEIATLFKEKQEAEVEANKLRFENEELKSKLKQLTKQHEQVALAFENIRREVEESERTKRELEDLRQWTRGLVAAIHNAGIMTNARSVLKEYQEKTTKPKGIWGEGI